MALGKHLDLGALATGTANYIGYHREPDPAQEFEFIPVGYRNRVVSEYGVDYVEERESLDKYSKYNK